MMKIVLVQPHGADQSHRALDILREEIIKRTSLPVALETDAPKEGAWIAVGTPDEMHAWAEQLRTLDQPGPEGWRIWVESKLPLKVVICGTDERGCLYGCGHLLRKLELLPGILRATDELQSCSVTPKYPLRGHQLAYRDKQNTCPNWLPEDFDAYIRSLALFGANAIEILPPRTDDRLFSPLFKMHPMEMMTKLSEIIHGYGLDVWLWYPNLGEDYEDPDIFQRELDEREKVFAALPYLEGILIPAGDPGELHPRQFFEITGRMMEVAHRYHPQAKVYIAPQIFAPDHDWYECFYQEISREPEWLYGVCFAPWVGDTLPEMVSRLPEKYRGRIRHYPDITHTASSQFEVPLWDAPLALMNGRESCCPRPAAMKLIHNLHSPFCIGSITYCEGIHDDVNKFLWTDQDVDPNRDAESLVRDYVRLLIDPEHVEELTNLIFALERNWQGNLRDNAGIEETFSRFERLDASLRPEVRANYRYKMLYQRSMLDAYIKRRYTADQALEQEARQELGHAEENGADLTIRRARALLNRTFHEPEAEDLRFRLQQEGQALFETPGCRMQQSSDMHNAQKWIRGAWLDTLNMPLNDTQYYQCHFKRILAMTDEAEKLTAINELLHRTDPGPGGRYIALGALEDFQHYVIQERKWEEDPGALRSPHLFHDLYGLAMRFHASRSWYDEYPIPLIWLSRARTLYGTPLTVRVDGLTPGAHYVLQITYPDMIEQNRPALKIALTANGRLIHDQILRDEAVSHEPVYRYELPDAIGSDGLLTLTWRAYDQLYPATVSELWLIRA